MKTIEQIIDMLNSMMKDDPEVLDSLLKTRVPCNLVFSDRPDINVRTEDDGTYTCSVLGLLNAVIGHRDDGYGKVSAHLNVNSNTFEEFSITKRKGD